ncbi:MAG: type IV pilus twitching motility protein PilT [Planctomycetota bacterium]
MITLEELLRLMLDMRGSDLHLTAGSRPRIRVDGDLKETDHPVLDGEMTQNMIYGILDDPQIVKFEKEMELDLSFGIAGVGRFRVNVFYQRGAVGSALRVIPFQIKTFAELSLPEEVCTQICNLPKGLVLVTGATGSGKSTSLAAMVDYVNQNRMEHIITIEDPIEFVHQNKKCLINQREVGQDTLSFKDALKHVLRQDPDVVLIGEMRDMETMQAGLELAETGHLTFATLHTSDCVQTLNRIIDSFPGYQQSQIRTQLSFVLEAVFCQQLLPIVNNKGRCLASEVMLANDGVRSLIREDKAHQIYSMIQTGGKQGMATMNQALYNLYKRGMITFEMAMSSTTKPEDLKQTFQRGI